VCRQNLIDETNKQVTQLFPPYMTADDATPSGLNKYLASISKKSSSSLDLPEQSANQ
jgi:hypothetical protein